MVFKKLDEADLVGLIPSLLPEYRAAFEDFVKDCLGTYTAKSYMREYSQKHKEHLREVQRRWCKANADKVRHYSTRCENKRRAFASQANHEKYTKEDLRQRFLLFNDRCAYCGISEKLAIDHFIPLIKGGGDCISNIVPACRQCNSSKNNRDGFQWYERHPLFTKERLSRLVKVLG